MDTTNSNTAAYWVAGIIVLLAVILGAWLLAGGTSGSTNVGIPNTGAQPTSSLDTAGAPDATGTAY